MILANTTSGLTPSFNPLIPAEFEALQRLILNGAITALSILADGVRHVLILPKLFRSRPVFGAEQIKNKLDEIIGERVFAHADNVRVSLSFVYRSKMITCELSRVGRMAYNRAY